MKLALSKSMMFSKRTQYALRAIMYLAVNVKPGKKMGVNVIAKELDVPKQFLSKILQTLVNNKLLHSSKGKMGGFYLTPKNLNSNCRVIIEIFDGDDLFCSCVMGLPTCSSDNPCPLHAPTVVYRQDLINKLEKNSISELATMMVKDGLTI